MRSQFPFGDRADPVRVPSVLAAVAVGQNLVLVASVPGPGKKTAQYDSAVAASG